MVELFEKEYDPQYFHVNFTRTLTRVLDDFDALEFNNPETRQEVIRTINEFGWTLDERNWEKTGQYFLAVVDSLRKNEEMSSFQAAFALLRSFCITTETDKHSKETIYRTGRDV